MTDAPLERVEKRLHVLPGVTRDVLDDVEIFLFHHLGQLLAIGAVAVEPARAERQLGLGNTTVEGGDLVAMLGEFAHEREAIEAGSTHDQYFHHSSIFARARAPQSGYALRIISSN